MESATSRLTWLNFGHLFSASLIPFSTSWIATTKLAPLPVSLYATVFLFVNITYIALCWETLDRRGIDVPKAVLHKMHVRSAVTLGISPAGLVEHGV